MNPPSRGEVYWLNFDPATGAEMASMHPCVIVQNDVGNRHSALTIVAAVTSNTRAARLPVGVSIPAGDAGLTRDSVVHCGHLYTVDQQRLGQCLGCLSPQQMAQVEQALAASLGLP
ncbi:MAG: type II toxin-antitoxin system PemK/MazF family toxin [Gemmataceae bacterium]